jgi:hypothetical protein
MKALSLIVVIIFLGMCSVGASGCGQKIEKYGDWPGENSVKTAVSSILFNPKEYLDKEVAVEGEVSSQCPSGCWLYLRDSSGGKIYVELQGTSFSPIPQRVGRKIAAKGIVFQSENESKEMKILAKGLIIK